MCLGTRWVEVKLVFMYDYRRRMHVPTLEVPRGHAAYHTPVSFVCVLSGHSGPPAR